MSCVLEMCLFGTLNWIRKSNQIRSSSAQTAPPNLSKSMTYVLGHRSRRPRRKLSIARISLPVTLGPLLERGLTEPVRNEFPMKSVFWGVNTYKHYLLRA